MKSLALLLGAFAFSLSACAATPSAPAATAARKFGDATPLEWSVRLAKAEMARLPAQPKWTYTESLLALSLLKLNDRATDPAYVAYAERVVLNCLSADGTTITGYKLSDYTLDALAPAKVLLALYEKKPTPRLLAALQLLRSQFATHPRTASGGFWHKEIYPHQMWLDGIFMASPVLAHYGKIFNEPADFDEVAKQILLVGEHTYDPKTGLFYHGWDESKTLFWANKETGLSPNFWGRAVGWYAMGIVDTLEFLPADHPSRAKIIELLGRLAAGVARWQDAKTGLWWQAMDQGSREGNYLEATVACQLVNALAKAVNHGWLPREKNLPVIERAYAGIVRDLLKTDASGVSLVRCCSVAGLGPATNTRRDGSFAYYISEPIVSNDLKGVGPLILAGIELDKLFAAPATSP